MSGAAFDPVTAVLLHPARRGGSCWRCCRATGSTRALNVVATLPDASLAALSLFCGRPAAGDYLLVDDLNIVFIVLTTFVGFTTSVFSASYIGHELEIGRLTPS